MNRSYLLFALGLIFIVSCQKNTVEEEVPELEVEHIEFFNAEVNGKTYSINDPETIAGTVYPSYDTGNINFDFAAETFDAQKDIKAFTFKVCFYDGPGTYYTGTQSTVSWAMYWSNDELWENHYAYDLEPGVVVVTRVTDEFVEGSFRFDAYNSNLESTVNVKGQFGLLLEPREDYRY